MTSTIQAPSSPTAARQSASPGLPPTGLQQQLNSLRDQYQAYRTASVRHLGSVGTDVNANAAQNQQSLRGASTRQKAQPMAATMGEGEGAPQLPSGQTSLQQLAQRLAQSYGLAIGRDQLIDAEGNFNFTADQLANASGGAETMGTAAAKLNYIAAAIQNRRTSENMKKSEAALQAGLGLASKRARGSMVETQQQFYRDLSTLYQNQDYEAADFSFFIQKEQTDIQNEILRKVEKLQKKKGRSNFWTGVVLTGIGIVSGNALLIGQGAAMAGTSASETGYF